MPYETLLIPFKLCQLKVNVTMKITWSHEGDKKTREETHKINRIPLSAFSYTVLQFLGLHLTCLDIIAYMQVPICNLRGHIQKFPDCQYQNIPLSLLLVIVPL
jgi:hypothetical protein